MLKSGHKKRPPGSCDPEGHLLRSARDSNPQALSGARFRGECISHSASAPSRTVYALQDRCAWIELRPPVATPAPLVEHREPKLCDVSAPARSIVGAPGLSCGRFAILAPLAVHRNAGSIRATLESNLRSISGRFQTAPHSRVNSRGARIRTGDLCDPNAALYRTEPRPEFKRVFCAFNHRTGWD